MKMETQWSRTCAWELKYCYKGSSPNWGSAYVNGVLSNKQPMMDREELERKWHIKMKIRIEKRLLRL